MKPLIILMVVVSTGSFFVINNLTPFSAKQMYSLLTDIRRQKQELKFQDGIFFNGIPNMSIRVGHQEANSKLNNLLIYNSSSPDKMQTTVADSGYIRISDDRKYLEVKIYNGELYEKNRDSQWYTKDTLTHHIFDRQEMLIPLSGFAFERGDSEKFNNSSETKTMFELSHGIDSLVVAKDSAINDFRESTMRYHIYRRYSSYKSIDSLPKMAAGPYIVPNLDTMSVEMRQSVMSKVQRWAEDAQSFVNHRSGFATYTSSMLYLYQIDYQRKIALPFSIMIFFLIGAPLGAIIRKGGLGMPIVVSVIFFVVYYIITIMGEKFVKDGAMPAFVGVWMSAMILFPIAIFLTYKSTNDSALLNAEAYINKYKFVKAKIITTYTNVKKWLLNLVRLTKLSKISDKEKL